MQVNRINSSVQAEYDWILRATKSHGSCRKRVSHSARTIRKGGTVGAAMRASAMAKIVVLSLSGSMYSVCRSTTGSHVIAMAIPVPAMPNRRGIRKSAMFQGVRAQCGGGGAYSSDNTEVPSARLAAATIEDF
jgi:hypothetical protein